MFTFNFNNDEEVSHPVTDSDGKVIQWYESQEVNIPENIKDMIENITGDQILKVEYNCGTAYSCLSPKEVMNMLKEKSDNDQFIDVLKANNQHSDLLPGKYEGGLKTWECTKDLVTYFIKNVVGDNSDELKGKSVLDLGCGSGILGITCLLRGAHVTFQDYNKEVLEAMTIPNIFLNCDNSVKNKVKLYSGDWSSFLNLMMENSKNEDNKYDYILTSETIYNPTNYGKIIAVIKKLLKSEGSAFVAAKTHYFGVGGNIQEFNEHLQQEGLISTLCWETTEGVVRVILKVQLS